MGWNDHVDFIRMKCLECGAVDTWEMWDEVAVKRYDNELGRKLGHDAADNGTCPNCGSKRGEVYDPDYEED